MAFGAPVCHHHVPPAARRLEGDEQIARAMPFVVAVLLVVLTGFTGRGASTSSINCSCIRLCIRQDDMDSRVVDTHPGQVPSALRTPHFALVGCTMSV